MTRQEAIAILERLQEPEAWEPQISEDAYTALQMAIDALDEDKNVGSKGDMIYRQDAIHVVSGLDSSFVKYIEELPPAQPKPLTEAEVVICKLYLDDLDKYKTCNEYKLLMGLLDGTAFAQPEIIHCKDCRWQKDQSGSTAWLPCRAIVTPSDFYCGRAERRTDEPEK